MAVNNYFRLKLVKGAYTGRDLYTFDDGDPADTRLAFNNARERASVWSRTHGEPPPAIVVMRQPRHRGPWAGALVVGEEPVTGANSN